jgi:hypothetical protein
MTDETYGERCMKLFQECCDLFEAVESTKQAETAQNCASSILAFWCSTVQGGTGIPTNDTMNATWVQASRKLEEMGDHPAVEDRVSPTTGTTH